MVRLCGGSPSRPQAARAGRSTWTSPLGVPREVFDLTGAKPGGTEKGSHVATCAEVAVDRPTERVRLIRVIVAFADGRILDGPFASYRVPRFADVPPIEVVAIDRKDLPSAGAGETPIVGIAPTVGNAIFAATGVRLRGMPLVPEGVVPGLPG